MKFSSPVLQTLMLFLGLSLAAACQNNENSKPSHKAKQTETHAEGSDQAIPQAEGVIPELIVEAAAEKEKVDLKTNGEVDSAKVRQWLHEAEAKFIQINFELVALQDVTMMLQQQLIDEQQEFYEVAIPEGFMEIASGASLGIISSYGFSDQVGRNLLARLGVQLKNPDAWLFRVLEKAHLARAQKALARRAKFYANSKMTELAENARFQKTMAKIGFRKFLPELMHEMHPGISSMLSKQISRGAQAGKGISLIYNQLSEIAQGGDDMARAAQSSLMRARTLGQGNFNPEDRMVRNYIQKYSSQIEESSRFTAKGKKYAVIALATGTVVGLYWFIDGNQGLRASRQELQRLVQELSDAVDNLDTAKKEVISLIESIIEVSAEQGVDLGSHYGESPTLSTIIDLVEEMLLSQEAEEGEAF